MGAPLNQFPNGHARSLEPHWVSGTFDLVAVQKSGDLQFGSVRVPAPKGDVRTTLGYRRYLDCDRTDDPGQDYAIARGDREYLVGVLADGVGQSFYGNLAAERVGNWLLERLWAARAYPPVQADLEAGLKQEEQKFAEMIAAVSLDHLPDWHRAALEATRRSGSQSVFAAYVWDLAEMRCHLYQAGDITVLVVQDGQLKKIESEPRGRWSSAGKSQLHLLATDLPFVTSVLMKTDGADPVWGQEIEDETATPETFEQMAAVRAANDDVSFVAGCLVTKAVREDFPVRSVERAYLEQSQQEYVPSVPIYVSASSPRAAAAPAPARSAPPARVEKKDVEVIPPDRQSAPTRMSNALIAALSVVAVLLVGLLYTGKSGQTKTAKASPGASQTPSPKPESPPNSEPPKSEASQKPDSPAAENAPKDTGISANLAVVFKVTAIAAHPQTRFAQKLLTARDNDWVFCVRKTTTAWAGLSVKGTQDTDDVEIFQNNGDWYLIFSKLPQIIHLQLFPVSDQGVRGSKEGDVKTVSARYQEISFGNKPEK